MPEITDSLRQRIDHLKTHLTKASSRPWHAGHLGRPDIDCECTTILDEGHTGGIGEVFVDNGRLISDGGNDAPRYEEAVANLNVIVDAVNIVEELIALIEG